jgi:hypothetical protein
MFNLSSPLRRRSGGPPLNPSLPEHTPKKRRVKEPVLSTEGHQFDPQLGSRIEQAVDDRHRQIMSAQAPLKERIEDKSAKGAGDKESAKGAANEESAKGAGNDESAKGAANEESAEGSGNDDIAHSAAPREENSFTDEGVKDHSLESSNASTADNSARAMTDLMWQDHPSALAQLPTWSMPAPKSAKTVFFEENDKGSSPKWGDQDDEETPSAPLWNYNTTNELKRTLLPLPPCLLKRARMAPSQERMMKIPALKNRSLEVKLIALMRASPQASSVLFPR